jgi:hypothetical protein
VVAWAGGVLLVKGPHTVLEEVREGNGVPEPPHGTALNSADPRHSGQTCPPPRSHSAHNRAQHAGSSAQTR